ncbi:MAG: saccharopine dehydrogenase [Pseudomonadota bacterium]
MTHLWVRAEQRDNEQRVGIMPDGAAALLRAGFAVTVEQSATRAIATERYAEAGCQIAPQGGWTTAPDDAIIFGLKELPEDGTPLTHRHIMFGHAFKGQPAGRELLRRFKAGGGALYDIEYLVDPAGRRVAAFGYWAGFAGAAISLLAFATQPKEMDAVGVFQGSETLISRVSGALAGRKPSVLIIGAGGRVGAGAGDLCDRLGLPITRWDIAETAHGGPFPEVLEHDVFVNAIFAQPGVPVFVPASAADAPRNLKVIGDVACDPTAVYSPIKVYDRTTSWAQPTLRVAKSPLLDVMAIDNLPSLLPQESSEDFAAQLLPSLMTLDRIDDGVWGRAAGFFREHAEEAEINL